MILKPQVELGLPYSFWLREGREGRSGVFIDFLAAPPPLIRMNNWYLSFDVRVSILGATGIFGKRFAGIYGNI